MGSKNGTYFDGARERRFYLTPGKAFIVGARLHRFLALNDEMRTSYPALVDILGAENEHTIGSASETPSPSDVILAAVAGVHLLITGEPHCEQDRLARIIHKISLFHERPMIELTPDQIPTDRKEQSAFMKQKAARSTLVLDLDDDPGPLRSTFVSLLFAAKQQVRVIVLARTADIVYKALGWQHCDKLQHVWLRPVASRPGATARLLDRMFEEHASPLRMSHLTPDNQDALRNHDWPDNFASLRKAAAWLTAIYRLGTINKAAHALEVPPASLYRWYSHTLGLIIPLSNRSPMRDLGD